MQIKVNGQNIDVTLENEKTIGDLLQSFESEIAKNDATTVGIILDGKEISAAEFDGILSAPITDTTALELSIVSKKDVEESFKEIATKFNALVPQLNDVPVLLQSGKDKEASVIISTLANEFDSFCRTASLSALFPSLYDKLVIDGKNLNEFFKEFSPILTDFENAMEAKDTVTVGDLSEYEIGPRLQSISTVLSQFN